MKLPYDWKPDVEEVVQPVEGFTAPGWRGVVVGIYGPFLDVRWETGPGENDCELTRVRVSDVEPFVWPGSEEER